MTSYSRRPGSSFGLPVLLDLFDGDRAAIGSLLEAAIAAMVRDLAEIEAAAVAGQREVLVAVSHRLKGTSGTIDARRIFEVTAALEAAARDGGAPIAALVGELARAVGDVEADVAAYLAA